MDQPLELSVCIPVYNEDVRDLCRSLLSQLHRLNTSAEILLYDDYSRDGIREINRVLAKDPSVNYIELPKNTGRSSIRNRLGKDARGKFLLFLDCDSLIISKDFISKYLGYAAAGHPVIVGGSAYPEKAPGENKSLHWKYGSTVEARPAKERNREERPRFHSNNFLIRKEAFCTILFNERLNTYGHEDTFFGFELKQKGIDVLNIENAVLHNKLETNQKFIEKTEDALRNLIRLGRLHSRFRQEVNILRLVYALKHTGLSYLIAPLFRRYRNRLYLHLTSDDPSLFLFNLYRIGFLCDNLDRVNTGE